MIKINEVANANVMLCNAHQENEREQRVCTHLIELFLVFKLLLGFELDFEFDLKLGLHFG